MTETRQKNRRQRRTAQKEKRNAPYRNKRPMKKEETVSSSTLSKSQLPHAMNLSLLTGVTHAKHFPAASAAIRLLKLENAEPIRNVSLLQSGNSTESWRDSNETKSLLNRMKYRILQSENSAWASASLFLIIVLIFAGIMKTQLWKKYKAPTLIQMHDDVDHLSFQSATELFEAKDKWSVWFRERKYLTRERLLRIKSSRKKPRRSRPNPNTSESGLVLHPEQTL